jgi:hypothetical protein
MTVCRNSEKIKKPFLLRKGFFISVLLIQYLVLEQANDKQDNCNNKQDMDKSAQNVKADKSYRP